MFDLNFIINRIRNIVFIPVNEWEVIKNENHNVQRILVNYLLPIIFTIGLADLLGGLIFESFFSLTYRVLSACFAMFIPFVTIIVTSFLISILAPSFGAKNDFSSSLKLVTYSFSIQLVLNIITNLLPFLSIIGILGLYYIFIIWHGVVPVMNVSGEKRVSFVILSVLIILVISILCSFLFNLLLTPFMVTNIEI
ncbi:MAG: hypothetical protein A2046_03560 [Bacteroidetes bacterium GWA2_30_7]|nr:MAG: hypothetical protein A2046_03560 [Bacteroidetes bacterium GWA2_30_7]